MIDSYLKIKERKTLLINFQFSRFFFFHIKISEIINKSYLGWKKLMFKKEIKISHLDYTNYVIIKNITI